MHGKIKIFAPVHFLFILDITFENVFFLKFVFICSNVCFIPRVNGVAERQTMQIAI